MAIAHVLCLVDEVEGSAAHLEVDALPPRLRARIVAKRDQYERGVRALVAGGVRAGMLHAADATIATRAFLGALNWTAHWFRPDGPQSPQQIASRSRTTRSPVSCIDVYNQSAIGNQSAICNNQHCNQRCTVNGEPSRRRRSRRTRRCSRCCARI